MIQANEAMQPGPPHRVPPHPSSPHCPQASAPASLQPPQKPSLTSRRLCCCLWSGPLLLGSAGLEGSGSPPQDGAGQEGSGSPVGPTSQVQVLGSSQHLSSSGSSTRSDTNTTTSPSIYTPFSASKTGTSTAHDSATTTHVPQPA